MFKLKLKNIAYILDSHYQNIFAFKIMKIDWKVEEERNIVSLNSLKNKSSI